MPACPYAPHRLALDDDLRCRHCGRDLRLYAALRDLPAVLYNEGRRLWDRSRLSEARGWLAAALLLRPDLREAHWLLGAVEARLGDRAAACRHLQRARELGAAIDPETLAAAWSHGRRRRRGRRRWPWAPAPRA